MANGYLSGVGTVEMARGYGKVYGVRSQGGNDVAYFFGSTGNDTFSGTPTLQLT